MTKLTDLIICPSSRKQLVDFTARPSHAVMLLGEVGVGLGTIAKAVAAELAGADVVYIKPTLHKQQKTVIINADDVADLSSMVRNRRQHALVVIIDGADQAANGVFEHMLKLIEEPVANVHYIFTAHTLKGIPETILSRSSLIKIELPSSHDCVCLLSDCDAKKASQIKFIADRRPALIQRLLTSGTDFDETASQIETAKKFIQTNVATRVELVDAFTDKIAAVSFCGHLAQLLTLLAANGRLTDANQLSKRLNLLAETTDRLAANGNLRIQLINLAVNF
ncbi:MAG: AAA family ATPase [Candidatus Saccharibacteria bacterium]|nr:AAA family ATPase [Candidatus Saccharibacteria bacterium]